MSDLRYAVRSFARAPIVTAAAVLTIALAICGTVSVFSLLNAVLLRALPYAESERLVAVWVDVTRIADSVGLQDPRREWTNYENHRDLQERSQALEDVAAFTGWGPTLKTSGEARRITGVMVTVSGLELLGVTPQHGRGFLPAEGEAGADGVVVIGHGLWQREFSGDQGAVGRVVSLDGAPYTIIGVLPPGFRFPFQPGAEIIAPFTAQSGDRGAAYLRQFGRLAGGVTVAQAQAELDTIAAALRTEYPEANRDHELYIEPLQDALNLAVRPHLVLLQAAALFVMLIAIANLASLMVARASARAGEFSVRASLGATRLRQFRLLWTEGMVLASASGVLGLAAAAWGIDLLVRAFPDGFGAAWDVRVDVGAVSVALAIVLLAGTIIALASHFAVRRLAPAGGSGARITGQAGASRTGAILVALNFSVALAVTVTGVLLYQSQQRLAAADLGYQPAGVMAATVQLSRSGFPDAVALKGAYERLQANVAAIPGVDSVGLSSGIPLGNLNTDTRVIVEGRPGTQADGRVSTWFSRVTPGYFETMGIRVRDGRAFRDSDSNAGRRVILVNEAFVREHLGGAPPLGVRVGLGPDETPDWFDIVGVVDDVRFFDVSRPETPAIYLPAWVLPGRSMYVTLRTSRDPDALAGELRRAVSAVDANLALDDLRSMVQRVEADLMVPRTVSRLTLLFAGCAMLLAAIGVYGTLAQAVVRRTRELGVRRALGALESDVFRLVLRQGATPVCVGLVLGLPLAYVLGRQMRQILYEVSPLNVSAWMFAIVLLAGVAFCAAAVPGRRAAHIDPMAALREE